MGGFSLWVTWNPQNTNHILMGGDHPLNRRWVLIFSVLIILMGLNSPLYSVIGILTLLFGVFLYFTDSWVLYSVIFSVWVFGGIFAWLYSISGIWSTIFGVVIVLVGSGNLYYLAKQRKTKIKGHT